MPSLGRPPDGRPHQACTHFVTMVIGAMHASSVTLVPAAWPRNTWPSSVDCPSEGVIRLPLQHDPADRRRIVVDEAGRPSQTRYRVVSSEHGCSLVRCELVTGRTHQIGVHLAASGWPILSDRTYGAPDPRVNGQALHAWRITFPHPITRKPLKDRGTTLTGSAAVVYGNETDQRT